MLDLILDTFLPGDAPVLCAADHDPEHRRRFEFPEDFVPSLEHSRAVIGRWAEERRAGVRFPFAVRHAAAGTLLGGCELSPLGEGAANISYWTYPPHRGRGIATEAVRRLCAIGFGDLGFRRIELSADHDNLASRRVAIRSGFREVGVRDGRVLHVLDASDAEALT
ncbi:MAG TPA: GNAT family N-acetyltransferase [Longimicrobium sp.]|jgi:RimJ/RimL family protein N-acetyltransferase|nr:GNAT family N-acetyltransferase [Longimicrobium sp.]